MIRMSLDVFFMIGRNLPLEDYCLYIVENDKECLYIGISESNTYNRFFGFGGHCPGKQSYHSLIGLYCISNSSSVYIELYRCNFSNRSSLLRIEAEAIKILSPKLNRQKNIAVKSSKINTKENDVENENLSKPITNTIYKKDFLLQKIQLSIF